MRKRCSKLMERVAFALQVGAGVMGLTTQDTFNAIKHMSFNSQSSIIEQCHSPFQQRVKQCALTWKVKALTKKHSRDRRTFQDEVITLLQNFLVNCQV